LSDGLLSGRFADNTRIQISMADGRLTFTPMEQVIGSSDVEIQPVGSQTVKSAGDGPLFESAVA